MKEKAEFTYFTLGKASEKQIKVIENQGAKQIKSTTQHGKQLVKSNAFAEKQIIPFGKQKEIFYKLVAEKTE